MIFISVNWYLDVVPPCITVTRQLFDNNYWSRSQINNKRFLYIFSILAAFVNGIRNTLCYLYSLLSGVWSQSIAVTGACGYVFYFMIFPNFFIFLSVTNSVVFRNKYDDAPKILEVCSFSIRRPSVEKFSLYVIKTLVCILHECLAVRLQAGLHWAYLWLSAMWYFIFFFFFQL